MDKLVTYLYDGSGVALRARCTVLHVEGDDVRIRVALDHPDAFDVLTRDAALRGNATGDDTFIVPKSHITEPGSYAPLASFNFLD